MTLDAAELAGLLGVDARDRTTLEAYLSAAKSFVQRELTGHSPNSVSTYLDRATRVQYFSGGDRGRRHLVFAQDVVVTLVELEDTWLGGSSFTPLAAADWTLTGRTLRRGSGLEWPPGEDNIRVTNTRGYDDSGDYPMPADLKQAVYDLAGAAFRNRAQTRPTAISADGLSLEVQTKVPSSVWQTVKAYRLPEWC